MFRSQTEFKNFYIVGANSTGSGFRDHSPFLLFLLRGSEAAAPSGFGARAAGYR